MYVTALLGGGFDHSPFDLFFDYQFRSLVASDVRQHMPNYCPDPSGLPRLRDAISRLSDARGRPRPTTRSSCAPQLACFPTDASGVAHGGFGLQICIANAKLNHQRHCRNAITLSTLRPRPPLPPPPPQHATRNRSPRDANLSKSAALRAAAGVIASG